MKTIEIQNIKIQVPSSFSELTPEAYVYALHLIARGKSKGEFLLYLFLYITNIKVGKTDTSTIEIWVEKKRFLAVKNDFYYSLHSLDWLLEEKNNKPTLRNAFAIQLMPKINVKDKTYYGPTTAFSSVIWGEYIMIQTYYSRYLRTNNRKWLYYLMAVLYRESNGLTVDSVDFKGEFRVQYSSARDEVMASFWEENATDAQLIAVCHYVIGGLSHLKLAYPNAFVEKHSEQEEELKINDPFKSLLVLTDTLAQDATKTEMLTNTSLHLVCQRIDNIALEDRKKKKFKPA